MASLSTEQIYKLGYKSTLLENGVHSIYRARSLLVSSPSLKVPFWKERTRLDTMLTLMSPSTWFWTPATPSPPYIKAITRCHKCVSSFAKNHDHFLIKAWLKLPIFLTPSDLQQWVNKQNSTPPKSIWTTLLRHPQEISMYSL